MSTRNGEGILFNRVRPPLEPVAILSPHNISGAVTNSAARRFAWPPYPPVQKLWYRDSETVPLKTSEISLITVFFGCFLTDTMDELKKLVSSRRGHKSHLSKVLNNVDEILQKLSYTKESEPDSTLTSSEAILLAEYQKQFRRKAEIFNELDEKIIENTDDEEKLEAAVFDSADLQSMLSEKIALISHTLEVDSPHG